MSLRNKKYFCYEIFKNISMVSHNGKVKYQPCSLYQGNFYESTDINISKAIQSEGYIKLQNLVEEEQPILGCRECYEEEDRGRISRRLGAITNYEQFLQDTDLGKITGLDYSLGNLCNLKCVICHPNNSTAWLDEWQKIYPLDQIEKYNKNIQISLEDVKFLKGLKLIHFHGGGDPLLNDNHIKILNQIDDLSQVRIFYNVNGTIKPADDILKLWSKCRLVELYFSIDAVGKQFEYQRTNAKWEEVNNNIKWFKENMPVNHMFNINCTWSALNIYYLDEVVDWKKEILDTNRLGDPVNLIFQKAIGPTELTHIRPKAREQLVKKYKNYPELLKMVENIPVIDKPLDVFNEYIQKVDNVRNDDYKKYHSEWGELL